MDFLIKYTEYIKGLPFTSVAAGLPINNLYSSAPPPLITIPANGTWVSLLLPIIPPTSRFFIQTCCGLNNDNWKLLVPMTT